MCGAHSAKSDLRGYGGQRGTRAMGKLVGVGLVMVVAVGIFWGTGRAAGPLIAPPLDETEDGGRSEPGHFVLVGPTDEWVGVD